ncbi:MAG: hypothetical protein SYC29_05100 [Planctomycetota bacterium]|nr:hypothetical protein [Planctomycetota bacterium]
MMSAAILALAGAAPGQGTGPGDVEPATGDLPELVVPTTIEEDDGPPMRPPLLREGSHLVRVVGRLEQHPIDGSWKFIIDPADEHSPGHELAMMPGTLLAEMERMIESAPDHRLVFEMTGEVYIFRGRNYLMPTHPPLLIGREKRPEQGDPAEPPDAPASEEKNADDETEAAEDESTEDIIGDLQRAVGPVARRPEAESSAAMTEDTAVTGAPPADLVREGTVLLSRRGTIRRAGDGSFIFVFDADAEGLADPPMTLLPCLLLERMDRRIRQKEEYATVLLSGHVYTYQGRNYLLPKVYRIPTERTVLKP